MPEPSPTTPPGLLLATDLSARCDRPLERARQLADEFPVPLAALAVLDAPQAPGDVPPWQAANDILDAAAILPGAPGLGGAPQHDSHSDLLPDACVERLARHVVDNSIDLAILGLHEQSALMRLPTGSRSQQLLQEVACDTLLVRPGEQNEKT